MIELLVDLKDKAFEMFKLNSGMVSFFLMKVTERFDPSLNLLGRFEVPSFTCWQAIGFGLFFKLEVSVSFLLARVCDYVRTRWVTLVPKNVSIGLSSGNKSEWTCAFLHPQVSGLKFR